MGILNEILDVFLEKAERKALTGGRWVTINGNKVYIKGGKVVAGKVFTGDKYNPTVDKNEKVKKPVESKKEEGVKEITLEQNTSKLKELNKQAQEALNSGNMKKFNEISSKLSEHMKIQSQLASKQIKKEEVKKLPETKKFKDSKEEESYYNKQKEQYSKILNKEQIKSLDNYLEDSTDINTHLRTGKKVDNKIKKDISVIKELFNKKESVLKDDLTLKRVVGNNPKAVEFFNKLNVGDEYSDDGFVSTTLSGRTLRFIESGYRIGGKGGVKNITIIAKKGSKAVMVDAVGKEDAQFEYLLNSGSKFKVLDKGSNGLTVELL